MSVGKDKYFLIYIYTKCLIYIKKMDKRKDMMAGMAQDKH